MSTPYTVVTAAGDSRPLFLAAGFGTPKSLVPWHGAPVLQRAIASYVADLSACTVALHDGEDADWALRARVTEWFPDLRTVLVPPGAKGALVSALLALGDAPADAPLVIAGGDSFVEGGIARYVDDFVASGASGATIVFGSHNPRWSYVMVNDAGTVRGLVEKRVVSDLATTGVFMFRSSRAFVDAATWCLVNNATHEGRFYVSTALNWLVQQGQEVAYHRISREQYVSLALPTDFIEQAS